MEIACPEDIIGKSEPTDNTTRRWTLYNWEQGAWKYFGSPITSRETLLRCFPGCQITSTHSVYITQFASGRKVGDKIQEMSPEVKKLVPRKKDPRLELVGKPIEKGRECFQ